MATSRKSTDPRLKFGLYKSKIDVLVRTGANETDLMKSYDELFASCADEPLFVQDVAWSAYEYFVEEKIKSKADSEQVDCCSGEGVRQGGGHEQSQSLRHDWSNALCRW